MRDKDNQKPEHVQADTSPFLASNKSILDYLIATLGFGLCRAWIVICFATPLQLTAMNAVNWIYLVSGALAALFVAYVAHSLKPRIERFRRSLFIVTGISLILSSAIIPFALHQQIGLLLLTGFLIGGVGAGLLQVLWGERLSDYEVGFTVIVSPAAAIVTALFVFLALLEVSILSYIFFPLLSFILLIVMLDRSGITIKKLLAPQNSSLIEANSDLIEEKALKFKEENLDAIKERDSFHIYAKKQKSLDIAVGKLMFSIMIFSFLCRIFDSILLSKEDPLSFFGGSSIFSLVVVGVAFLLLAVFLKARFNPTFTYRLSLPLMASGLVAVALLFDTHAALSILLINIGYEFFDVLTWILFAEISRRERENSLRIFGLGVAFMFTGMSLGYLGSEILSALISSGSIQITVIAMLSILSLVVLGFLVLPEGTIERLANVIKQDKKETVSDDEPLQELSGERRLETNCELAASYYRLTPRESEVLVLLAYGRTLSIIARDLQIAKGTARTHMEKIYRKLAVHKQQELIDLVESMGEETLG